jgi:DNA-directed RNA polymerase specialized sigma24 family protein
VIDFEGHVKGTIGFWCNKLMQGATFIMHDVVTGEPRSLPSPYYPAQNELEAMVWVKVSQPKVWERLQTIWFDPSGARGVDRYLSVICTNTFIDEHRKMQLRPWDYNATSLSDPEIVKDKGADENDEGEIVALVDLITDESGEWLPFGIKDLIHVLTPQEYKVMFDHFVNDGDYRLLAEESGISKSEVARIARRAITKAKTWIEQLKHGPASRAAAYRQPVLVMTPYIRRNWRPDRMSSDLLDHWFEGTEVPVVPFFMCGHDVVSSAAVHQMRTGGAHWSLCETCYQTYWRSLQEQILADLHVAGLEQMLAELREVGTEALGSPEVVEKPD